MSNIKDRIKKYLDQQHVMQLATVRDGKPWNCSVYYVPDDKLNLYWASLPSRRHSREIAADKNVSIAISVQGEKDKKVIGIQAEGTAEMVENVGQIRPIAEKYATAFGRDKQWAKDFSTLKTKHRLYKFSPEKYVLFDEQNFKGEARREINVGS